MASWVSAVAAIGTAAGSCLDEPRVGRLGAVRGGAMASPPAGPGVPAAIVGPAGTSAGRHDEARSPAYENRCGRWSARSRARAGGHAGESEGDAHETSATASRIAEKMCSMA